MKTTPAGRDIATDIHCHLGADRPNLDALLRKWSAILKLQDWELIARYVRLWDLREKSEGQATICLRLKMAAIRILDPVDYCDADWKQDVERTLVHELLHIHLEFFGKPASPTDDDMREQAVESITRALVEMDRRGAA